MNETRDPLCEDHRRCAHRLPGAGRGTGRPRLHHGVRPRTSRSKPRSLRAARFAGSPRILLASDPVRQARVGLVRSSSDDPTSRCAPTIFERCSMPWARSDAVLYGESEGGTLAAYFAATHPDRVSALVLYGSQARYAWAPDYPMGMDAGDVAWPSEQRSIARDWGSDRSGAHVGRARRHHPLPTTRAYLRWSAKCIRYGASSRAQRWRSTRSDMETDIRSILGKRAGADARDVASRRRLGRRRSAGLPSSSRIGFPGAKYVELPGERVLGPERREHGRVPRHRRRVRPFDPR